MRASFLKVAAVVALASFATIPSFADNPGRHPAYLHALTDRRDARAHLERLSSEPVNDEEEHAIHHITYRDGPTG